MAAIVRGETNERPGGVSLNGATYQRRFMVRTTSVYDGPHQVVRAEGLPQMLTPYQTPNESDGTAYVIDLRATPRESPTEWYVDVDYGPVEETSISGANPFSRPIQISGGLSQHTRLTTRDYQGNPIRNSAKDMYGPQEVDDSRPELEITTTEAGFSLLTVAFYKDCLNFDPFLNFPPGTLKMQHIGFRTMQEGGVVFTEVTYHMQFRPNWWLELLDEGFYTNVAGVRERITIDDANGVRLVYPSEPQLLNGNGDKLTVGDPPKYLAFHMYPRAFFNPILDRGGGSQTGFLGASSGFGIDTPGQRTFPGF